MKRSVLGVVGVGVVLAAVLALVGPFGSPTTHGASTLAFEAKFETSGDFYDRFDRGYSGQASWNFPNGVTTYHGDHDLACEGPTTLRDVTLSGSGTSVADWTQMFWYCAPGGDPTKAHIMTGVVSVGYNIAWFSPKPAFSNITKVCWDINETDMGGRKWTQVLFVGAADATRFPSGVSSNGGLTTTRGTGGFDLGYTSPEFRDPNGPDTGIQPVGGTLAGFKSLHNSPAWFQSDTWQSTISGDTSTITGITDKAARYTHCLENLPNNVLRLTQGTPSGTRTVDFAGQIPQDARRVVFEDDNYNGPKDPDNQPDVNTWHWDNVQIYTSDGSAPATTQPPATTASTTTTVAPTTTAAPTTIA